VLRRAYDRVRSETEKEAAAGDSAIVEELRELVRATLRSETLAPAALRQMGEADRELARERIRVVQTVACKLWSRRQLHELGLVSPHDHGLAGKRLRRPDGLAAPRRAPKRRGAAAGAGGSGGSTSGGSSHCSGDDDTEPDANDPAPPPELPPVPRIDEARPGAVPPRSAPAKLELEPLDAAQGDGGAGLEEVGRVHAPFVPFPGAPFSPFSLPDRVASP
jgi:hypothetical protein